MWASTLVILATLCLWPGPLNAAEPTETPRNCTDEEHRTLKQEVGRACKCFKGGDQRHQEEVSKYTAGAAECSRFLVQNRCSQQCQ